MDRRGCGAYPILAIDGCGPHSRSHVRLIAINGQDWTKATCSSALSIFLIIYISFFSKKKIMSRLYDTFNLYLYLCIKI